MKYLKNSRRAFQRLPYQLQQQPTQWVYGIINTYFKRRLGPDLHKIDFFEVEKLKREMYREREKLVGGKYIALLTSV